MNEQVTEAKPGAGNDGADWKFSLPAAAGAMALRALASGRRGFWLDEYYTLNAARLPLAELVSERLANGHSPVYFLYAKAARALVGEGVAGLRCTTTLFVGVAVVLLGVLVRQLGFHRRIARTAMVFAALCPFWITIGLDYRYMMPVVMTSLLAAIASVVYARRPSMMSGVGLSVALALPTALHGSGWFVCAASCLFIILTQAAEPASRRPLLHRLPSLWPAIGGIVLLTPMFLSMRGGQGVRSEPAMILNLEWLARVTAQTVFNSHKLWMSVTPWATSWILALAYLVLGGGVAIALMQLRRDDVRGPAASRFIISWLVGIPLTLMTLSAFVRNAIGPVRYLSTLSIPLLIVLAIAWHSQVLSLRARLLYRAMVVLAFLVQGAASLLDRGELLREAIGYLNSNHRAGQAVVISTNQMLRVAFDHNKFASPGDLIPVSSYERDPAVVRATVTDAMQRSPLVWLFLYHEADPFEPLLEEMAKGDSWKIGMQDVSIGSEVRIVALWTTDEGAREAAAIARPEIPWGPAQAKLKRPRRDSDRRIVR